MLSKKKFKTIKKSCSVSCSLKNCPSQNPCDDPNGTQDREKILSPDIILTQDYLWLVRLDQAGEDLALHPYYSGKDKTDPTVKSSE